MSNKLIICLFLVFKSTHYRGRIELVYGSCWFVAFLLFSRISQTTLSAIIFKLVRNHNKMRYVRFSIVFFFGLFQKRSTHRTLFDTRKIKVGIKSTQQRKRKSEKN